jgi:hypothetical protein
MCQGGTGAYAVCLHSSYFYSAYVGGLLDFGMRFPSAIDATMGGSYHAGMINYRPNHQALSSGDAAVQIGKEVARCGLSLFTIWN